MLKHCKFLMFFGVVMMAFGNAYGDNNVVTTTNNKISTSILPDSVVTTGNLADNGIVTDATLKESLLDTSVMGTCSTETRNSKVETTCTPGSIMERVYNQLKSTIENRSDSI